MSPFTRCERGHDLTQKGAHIYLQGGNRVCRACHLANGPKGRTIASRHGAFDG